MNPSPESDGVAQEKRASTRLSDSLDHIFDVPVHPPALLDHPVPSAVGRQVGRFRIRSWLGSGTFGVVYIADDTAHPQPVALKLPRLEVLADAAKRKRFASEVALVTQLKHPNIVEVRQAIAVGSSPFIATELCDGPDLGQWMLDRELRGAELPDWQDSARLIASLADALHFAHQKGISHCDLKPANVLLSSKQGSRSRHGELAEYEGKVTDFGLAHIQHASFRRSRSSMMVGTPTYMAPEQLDRLSSGAATVGSVASADIYSLGVMLFELLTGDTPVPGEGYYEVIRNIRTHPAARLKQRRPDLPAGLDRVIETCLRKNPDARYVSAADLACDLRRLVCREKVLGKRYGVVQRLKHWCLQPDRMQTAGRFAICTQSLLTLWLLLSILFMQGYAIVSTEAFRSLFLQAITVILTAHLPLAWIGYKALQGSRWAAWAGALLTLVHVPAVVWAIAREPMLFRELYLEHHPYFTFANHAVVLLCFVPQFFLFVTALISGKRKK